MMLYRTQQILKLGAKSLWMHKLRSALTTLGIVFGVCSVIAMLAIGEGASRQTQAEIARLGSQNIIVKTVKPPEDTQAGGQGTQMNEYGLTYEDAERFRETIPNVEVVVPTRQITNKAQYTTRQVGVQVVGTVPWHRDITSLQMKRGRFLDESDMRYQRPVCIVDMNVYDKLFLNDEPINQAIKIGGDYYIVQGVVGAVEPVAVDESDRVKQTMDDKGGAVVGNVYMPLTTMKTRFGEYEIQVTGSGGTVERVELHQITVKVEEMEQVLPTRDLLMRLLETFHKKEDYQVIVPLELLRQAARTKRIFNIVLGAIAAISLLVGGIGIMNIMLATVSERTREIGIRRALGAKRNDIVVQFLTETLMLTFLGCFLGMLLGIGIPLIVTHFTSLPTVITPLSLLIAMAISGLVGITFGIYPAYRAANMDPIQSLRHE